MIPLPNLDDRMFEQLVEDAKKIARKYAPQWTDENLHDPGITMIELFAWLTEMQQFYMNQIQDRHYLKYLQLLGIKPKVAQTAKANVVFSGGTEPVLLPAGTPLLAEDVPFETADALYMLQANIEKVLVRSAANYFDYTTANGHAGISYYAFGEEARKGNKLYIGFDRRLPLNHKISLTLTMFDDYPVRLNPVAGEKPAVIPSARVGCYYYGLDEQSKDQNNKWLPVRDLNDETCHLSISGRITFTVPTDMQGLKVYPANDQDRFWICCAVEEEGYEVSPRIREVRLNAVPAVQRRTFSATAVFSGTGQANQNIALADYLTCTGDVLVQVMDETGGWRFWQPTASLGELTADDASYVLSRDEAQSRVRLSFGDGEHGRVLPKGTANVRVVSFAPWFAAERWLGRSNGLAGQSFQLPYLPVIGDTFELQVGRRNTISRDFIWEDWQRVDSFDASGPADRHFTLDINTGEIRFGDNIRGLIPEAAEEANICLLSYQAGGGESGNVAKEQINRLAVDLSLYKEIQVTNPASAKGGARPESLKEAKLRAKRELKKRTRAITVEDFEEIAQNTPGLRIARVKAIPNYAPGLKEYPEKTAPAQVTVVVVPFSQSATPVPSRGFLATVHEHLDQHRLLTTEIHVVGPGYVKVMVHAVVVRQPGIRINEERVIEELNSFLRPFNDASGSQGWPFGRTVYKGDIYGVIKGVEGVDFVQELWLCAEGTGIEIKPNGDICLPPYCLAYSGKHVIEVVEREDI